jgi:hypothetical protein
LKRKGKLKRNLGILLYVTAFIAVVTISLLYQIKTQPPTTPKEQADQYFKFSEAYALAEPLDPQNRTIRISMVGGFNVTAIGGNATNLYILGQGIAEEDSFFIPKLIQGESKEVAPITYKDPIPATKEEGKGWPLQFRISCNEAYGYVTVYVTGFVGNTKSPGS